MVAVKVMLLMVLCRILSPVPYSVGRREIKDALESGGQVHVQARKQVQVQQLTSWRYIRCSVARHDYATR